MICSSICPEYIKKMFRWIRWYITKPAIPVPSDGKTYLHVGSGGLTDTRFINVDIRFLKNVHMVSDGAHLRISDKSVDVIYSSHVLEHFSHTRTGEVLSEWYRVLKPEGELYISVPDFDRLLEIYMEEARNIKAITPFLMGAQGHSDDIHRAVFTRPQLNDLLQAAGFENIGDWSEADFNRFPFEDYAHYPPTRKFSLCIKVIRPYA